ncbi:hypothetical protein LINGRAPRIM_LOCUS1648 [Linum grandiflorum]
MRRFELKRIVSRCGTQWMETLLMLQSLGVLS